MNVNRLINDIETDMELGIYDLDQIESFEDDEVLNPHEAGFMMGYLNA